MMSFIYGMLGIFFGFLLFLLVLVIIVRIILNRCGFKDYSFSHLLSTIHDARMKEQKRQKQVSGMTQVLLPTILKDFPDFNEKEFYNQTEEALRTIFTSIERKDIQLLENDAYDLIRNKIDFFIRDIKDVDISYHYDDIIFHKHAIKSYQKRQGMIKLEISTTLEYYYIKKQGEQVLIQSKQKRQTRYTTSYVYIYDTKKAGFDVQVLGLNCPNCGSPISSLEKKTCSYCQSGLNITVAKLLKCWKIIDYKEDY